MIRHRSKIWALFLFVCIIVQLVTSVIGPTVISSVKQAIVEYETKYEEMQATEHTQEDKTEKEAENISETLAEFASISGYIFQCLGMIIASYGVFSFILAFRDEDVELLGRGVRMLVLGFALASFKFVIQMFLGGV